MKLFLYASVLAIIPSILVIRSQNKTKYIDYRFVGDLVVVDALYECRGSGLQCIGCCEITYCEKMNTTWISSTRARCPDGEICQNGVCVKNCDSISNVPFICTTSGMFPDPFDCQSYHFCTPDKLESTVLQSTKAKCGDGSVDSYGYNPSTTFCGDKLLDGKCNDFPVPICENILQKGIIYRSPSLYYVCLNHPLLNDTSILYPFQMACPFGKTLTSECGCV